jgi:perosamine synthetase
VKRKIAWWQPQLGDSELPRITEVLASNYLNEGAVTDSFEVALAKKLNVEYVVTTTSGTTALFLALKALDIGHGDQVIVPDITFIATANAVTMAGAEPVLVDIDPLTLNICPLAVERAITAKTRAIIPVHVSGRAADLPKINEIARSFKLHVIEDAAEAFLSYYEGKALGTFGIMGCFSLSPNKTISSGQGGFIATNDDAICKKLRQLKDQGRPARGTGGDDLHPAIGFNFKYTNLQAAIGLGQLELVDQRIQHLRTTYIRYREGLANVPGITVLNCNAEAGETPQWTDVIADNRDELCSFLAQEGIGFRKFWYPLHAQEAYRQPDSRFPNATKMSPKALWLPSSFSMSKDDTEYVTATIKEFMRREVGARQ